VTVSGTDGTGTFLWRRQSRLSANRSVFFTVFTLPVIRQNGFASAAPVHKVVHRAWMLNAESARHTPGRIASAPCFQAFIGQ
jgi:hypothetical protein